MVNFLMKTEETIAKILIERGLVISTAESCTGGLLSSKLTDVSGSSAYIKENYVTYANEAKVKLLNVSLDTLEKHGAVSEQCAKEMAIGLFNTTGTDIALCTTGVAGPTGGTAEKPVGTMFIGLKTSDTLLVKRVSIKRPLSRKKMKEAFAKEALEFLYKYLATTK